MAIQVDPTLPAFPISLELWHGMIEAGLLEDARVELLRGVIVEMNPSDPPHAHPIQVLAGALYRAAIDSEWDVRIQQPTSFGGSISEPQPDLAVVRRDQQSPTAHPTTAELVVEVAFSSHRVDRGVKAEIYAEAGIPEYWIVDVPGRRVEVRSVIVGGRYTTTVEHGPEATIAPAALPAATVVVGELLP